MSDQSACRRLLVPLCLVAWILGESPPAAGQPLAGQPSSRQFQDRVRVVEVEVPVQVLRAGVPVPGLSQESFRVFDRGQERALVGFEALDLERLGARSAGPEPGGAETEVEREARRSFLVVFDFLNNQGGYIGRGVDAIREMAAGQLGPLDRMAVIGLGSRGAASIICGFTADREWIGAALDYVQALAGRRRRAQNSALARLRASAPHATEDRAAAYGAAAVEAFGDGLDRITLSPSSGLDTSLATLAMAQLGAGAAGGADFGSDQNPFELGASLASYQQFRETSLYVEALGNLGSLLRGVEGQKHIMLMSQGPPIDTFVTGSGQALRDGGAGVTAAVERMTEQLSRSGWRIHTFGQGLGFNDSLFHLAHETGGTAFENYGRLERATADLIRETSVTYLLRFVADDVANDGRRHDLEVVLVDAPRGVEVRHRPHYYAPRPDRELSDVERRIVQAERRLEQAAGKIHAGLLAVPLPQRDRGASRVLVVVSLSADEVRRLATGDRFALELSASVGHDGGGDALRQRLALDQEGLATLPPDGITFVGDVAVDPPEASFQVVLEAGTREQARLWGVPTTRGPQALPPLFFVGAGERLLIREQAGDELFRWPLRLRGQELVPWVEPTVEQGARLGAILWLLRPGLDAVEPAVLITDGRGAPVEQAGVTVQRSEREEEAIDAVAVVDTARLEPGDYQLRVFWPGVEHGDLIGDFQVTEGR